MIILSIDTCGFYYSIAILNNSDVLCESKASEKNIQCEQLVSEIETLLIKASSHYSDLDIIIVTNGPGTFNGVRIGISVAYGISLARGIKIATISTLEVMAYKENAPSVCFAADPQIGFSQKFNSQFKPISEAIEVNLNETDDAFIFDINSYDASDVSNAVAAGLLYMKNGGHKGDIFYGKPPSIHVKSGSL